MELIYYLIFLDRDKMNVYRDKLAKVTARTTLAHAALPFKLLP